MRDVPKPYSWGNEASYEGSAGGAALPYLSKYGGNGGGIIWMTSSNTVTLNDTLVTVKGGEGEPYFHSKLGSGGGAGGSIHVVTRNIAGNADIDLSGGDGSGFGGGGGSGGRLVANLLSNFNSTNHLEQSIHWNGTINLSGGIGGHLHGKNRTKDLQQVPTSPATPDPSSDLMSGGDGEDGTSHQSKCFGGFSGPFCKPCPIGTYKLNFGYGLCVPCTNKPEYSFYDDIAQSSTQCSFQCIDGFEQVDVNPQCLTTVDLQVERVGGATGFLIVFLTFAILGLVMWIIIALRSACI